MDSSSIEKLYWKETYKHILTYLTISESTSRTQSKKIDKKILRNVAVKSVATKNEIIKKIASFLSMNFQENNNYFETAQLFLEH
ncbi:hypothetical protein BpHYR1_027572 [Brachionus plicatilis]|uniref:Uncharacterized protein n=1 Tax=Brachionus plicatilis TaxID=10195 RepID=A0A3M7PHD7_BRAPC|nr:hypothetical protein BpHYR1_027572 [Brachionus plicatilis]